MNPQVQIFGILLQLNIANFVQSINFPLFKIKFSMFDGQENKEERGKCKMN